MLARKTCVRYVETRPRENSFFTDFEKDSVRTRCVKNSFSIFLPSCFLGRVLRLSPGNTLITTSVFYQLIEQKLTKDWERFYKQAGLHDVFSAHVYRGHENKTGWQRKSLKNCHFFHNFSNSVNYQWEKPYFFPLTGWVLASFQLPSGPNFLADIKKRSLSLSFRFFCEWNLNCIGKSDQRGKHNFGVDDTLYSNWSFFNLHWYQTKERFFYNKGSALFFK